MTTICDLAPDLPLIDADPDQLHQVLVNLIVNAQQALETRSAPRELTIATRTGAASDTVELEVRDNGPGISDADARRIFEPFFTTKAPGSGTGIGLSFSLGVIQAHGGRLSLRPVAQGTSLIVELPLGAPAVRDDDAPAAASPAEREREGLVVDDDVDVADTLGELVAREGFRVTIAEGGAAAIDLLESGDYDLILTDLRMPRVDGPALFAWIEAHRPHLAARCGFLTGDVLSAASAAFLERAGRPYAEKPFTPASVAALIAAIGG